MMNDIYKKHTKASFARIPSVYDKFKANKDVIVCNEGTDDECLMIPLFVLNEFHITSVSREDFKAEGFDTSKVSDEKMQWIADKMSDNYVGGGQFWDDVRYYAEELGLPKINE